MARDLIGRTMKGNEGRFVIPIRTVPVKHQDESLSSLLPKRSQDMVVNESVDKDVRPLVLGFALKLIRWLIAIDSIVDSVGCFIAHKALYKTPFSNKMRHKAKKSKIRGENYTRLRASQNQS